MAIVNVERGIGAPRPEVTTPAERVRHPQAKPALSVDDMLGPTQRSAIHGGWEDRNEIPPQTDSLVRPKRPLSGTIDPKTAPRRP